MRYPCRLERKAPTLEIAMYRGKKIGEQTRFTALLCRGSLAMGTLSKIGRFPFSQIKKTHKSGRFLFC